ncbi:MAG: hypothetical protein IAE90_04965 [Ignavibacteria bacterium]|nr:hypothetical protein [Ignavibacteria bacterium]
MLSTTQILQLVLLAAIFAAAIFILAGRPKSAKGIASGPLFFISASILFLGFVVTEALFSIYYLKFVLGYGVNAALLSAAVTVILVLPFSGYTNKMIAVIRSVPFKISAPERKTSGITKQSVPEQTINPLRDRLPEILSTQNIEPDSKTESKILEQVKSEEKIYPVKEISVENDSPAANEKTPKTDVDPVISGKTESVKTADTQANAETGKSTTGNQPAKRKPRQKSAAKKPQGSQPQQNNTIGKTRGRKKK